VKVLIDTHIFLWWVNGDQLSEHALAILQNSDAEVYISIASLWEMTIKSSLGKLELPAPVGEFFPSQILMNSFKLLPIEIGHLSVLQTLPFHHRDPFDRIMISQAMSESMYLISADHCFEEYPVSLIW